MPRARWMVLGAGGPWVQADLDADLAAKGYCSGHLTARLEATRLPGAPHATVNAGGTLLEAPLSLALTADETDGAFRIDIGQLAWKSLHADGMATLNRLRLFRLAACMWRLAGWLIWSRWLGGRWRARRRRRCESDDQAATLTVTVRDAALLGTAAFRQAVLNATVTDPAGHAVVDGASAPTGFRPEAPGGCRAG